MLAVVSQSRGGWIKFAGDEMQAKVRGSRSRTKTCSRLFFALRTGAVPPARPATNGNVMALRRSTNRVHVVAQIVALWAIAVCAQAQEEVETATPRACPQVVDQPLGALSVDIRPRDDEGLLVNETEFPDGCWDQSGRARPPQLVCATCRSQSCCGDLLQLARFCHPRVYFEDAPLERCGVCPRFPILHSSAHFACDLLLLPAQLVINHKCPCVRTPTPHCCAPDACGASGCSVCGP